MMRRRGYSYPTLSDLVKREDDARRASLRADKRFSYDLTHAGGINDSKRNELLRHKREKEQVRNELRNIKSSYKRSSILVLQNPGNLEFASSELINELEDQKIMNPERSKVTSGKKYGRNYYGYKSEPGSNKPHFEDIKAIQDKYSPVKNYYEYSGPKLMDRRTREKLQSQKKENLSVQERVKSFSIGDDKGATSLNGYHVLPPTAPPSTPTEKTTKEIPSLPLCGAIDNGARAKEGRDNVKSETVVPPLDESEQSEILMKKLQPITKRQSKSKTAHEPGGGIDEIVANPKTALDLVFDADRYAPDGRIRTMHCLPDFDKSFKEAKQTRYVRTKNKREMEKELTVDEIFTH